MLLKGKRPVIVEKKNDLIAVKGVCLANSSFLREMLAFRKVPVYLNASVAEIKEKGAVIKDREGKLIELKGDSIITSVGYKSNPLAGKSRHTHIIGDADKVGNLRTVIWRAWDVCMRI